MQQNLLLSGALLGTVLPNLNSIASLYWQIHAPDIHHQLGLVSTVQHQKTPLALDVTGLPGVLLGLHYWPVSLAVVEAGLQYYLRQVVQ